MATVKGLKKLEDSKYDMTSMIDIVFLLLVFFILMPFKSVESKIENHLPKDSGGSQTKVEDIENVQIVIKRDGSAVDTKYGTGVSFSINGVPAKHLADIKVKLSQIQKSLSASNLENIPLVVNADEDVPFYFVLKALDISKLHGFTTIKFPKPPELNHAKKPRGI